MCTKNNTHIYVAKTSNNSDLVGWSLLLLAATVRSFVHLPLRLSTHNKMVLWPVCEGHARYNLPKKNVRSVRFVIERRGYCFNLSTGVALNGQFTMNGMWVKNNTHIYVAQTSNNRVISSGHLYCCLLPQCKAFRTCCLGFPITTPETFTNMVQ